MPTLKSLPPLVILPLEQFAGESDVACDEALASMEAIELSESVGGRDTFGAVSRPSRRALALEEATDRMIEQAYEDLD